MSDIRTRPSAGKRRGNQTQSFVKIRERTRLHWAKDCPYRTKENVKTAINSDIRAHSVEIEK